MAATRWKGFLRLSLVSAPVIAVPAAAPGGGEVRLHQLHAECHSRIRYKKTCPLHGEVPPQEIVMAYEYEKGMYVVIDAEEREHLHSRSEKSITLEKFVPPESVDPIYYSGQNLYLLPDGPGGQKPYAVLVKAMQAEGLHAIGQAATSGRDELVVVRPVEGLLAVSFLRFASQVKQPAAVLEEPLDTPVTSDELKLARTLIQQVSADEAGLEKYRDTYTEKFMELIEAKIAGREIVAEQEEEEPPIVNLMDALRKSLAGERRPAARKGRAKRTRPAPRTAARRTRKSS